MNRELSAEMSKLLHKAGVVGVKKIYLNRSRNPDPAVRAKFEKNSNMEITKHEYQKKEAASAARVLGSLGGSVKSTAKSEAAKARNAKRKAEGKPEGGRPRKAPPMSIAVSRDGKPRTLALVSGGGVQYECVIRYPDGQSVRAKVQPEADGSIPDLRMLAKLNGFEVKDGE